MRNKAGQLAIVVPSEESAEDIKAHGGKVVLPIEHVPCALGGSAWQTMPTLRDGYGNRLAWDDRDLMPLGEPLDESDAAIAQEQPNSSATLTGSDEGKGE